MTEGKTTRRPAGRRPDPATAIFTEVRAARKLLGDKPMPLAGGQRPTKGRAHHQREANRWRSIETSRQLASTPGWDSTLLAACFEAFAEQDTQHSRDGLVRLAALAVAAVESIDREAA
ncbi:hypothetical protein [Streptomyces chattanoogensis]|uniref:hypothetical protein n=1 Tax=Streptomyces chattanoogensis TaxID=66876 RepID=UPI0036BE518A